LPPAALAVSFALMTVLLLAGCAGSADPASPATAGTPSTGTSAAQEGSGTTGSEATASPASTADAGPGLDPEAAASIEDSVADAEQLLKELDQDFQQDDAATG
jgi:hypothetical protein